MFLVNTFAFATLVLCVAGSPIGDLEISLIPDAPKLEFPILEIPDEEKVHFGDKPVEDYPSLVSIGSSDGGKFTQFCGGSLITDQHILTAAHCFENATTTFRAVFGSRHKLFPLTTQAKVIEFGQDAWKLRPGYEGESNDYIYDTAVITLPRKVKLSKAIKITRLAKQVYPNNVRVVGWGRMNCNGGFPDYYLYAQGWIVDDETCSWEYGSETHSSQICAQFTNHYGDLSGSDIGDSGGPLFATANDGQDIQIGIVSLGAVKNEETPYECTDASYPLKYAKVAEAETFIKSVAPNAQFV